MKILFSGYHNPNYLTITEYIERAISKLGCNLISFDDRDFLLPAKFRKINFLNQWDLKNLNNKFIKIVLKFKPDICIVTGGHRILPSTIKFIKNLNIKTILWTIDAPIDFKPILDVASYYDYVFCGGTEAIEILNRHGIKNTIWLPFGCDTEIYKPVELSKEELEFYSSDISFVGTIDPKIYSYRVKILESLLDRYNISIWGPGKQKIIKRSKLYKAIRGGATKPEIINKIYSASKIILCIHYRNENILCYQASPRVFEVLATKSFLIVDAQKDVKTLFENKKHLVVFENMNDLIEKIDYYLKNNNERIKIAQNGYSEVVKKHTYIHRIETILKTIK